MASLRSLAEQPEAITINVMAHKPTKTVSMMFHTDRQYARRKASNRIPTSIIMAKLIMDSNIMNRSVGLEPIRNSRQ